MSRKWYQWEQVVEVPCKTCNAKAFQSEFAGLCRRASEEKQPVFAGIINLPDGSMREVFVTLGKNIGDPPEEENNGR